MVMVTPVPKMPEAAFELDTTASKEAAAMSSDVFFIMFGWD